MNKKRKRFLLYLLFSLIIGVVIGGIDIIFSKGLQIVSQMRESHIEFFLLGLPFAGVVIIYFYKKYGNGSLKGMGFVFDAAHTEGVIIPKRLIPFAILSTWITHLFGGSAGREGVAVQIGATVANAGANFVEKKSKIDLGEVKPILLSSGIAAGFSGLFGTPFAAVIFSMEVLRIGVLDYRALFPSLISAYTSYFVTEYFGINHFKVKISEIPSNTLDLWIKIIVVGLIFSSVGYLFAYLLKKIKTNKILVQLNPIKKIFLGGILLVGFLYISHLGRYSGLGTNLIDNVFFNETVYWYDWLLKILATVFTLGIGFQGGEVTPLFAIGATLGAFLGKLMGVPMIFLGAIGYSAVFGAATNTFFTAIFIGVEVFGYEMLPYYFIVCSISYIFSGELGIYEGQKKGIKKI